MPKPLYHSPSAQERPSSALVNDQWSREVVPRLPQQVNEQAKRLKAFVRVREVKSATDLLRGLLAYVLCGSAASGRAPGSVGHAHRTGRYVRDGVASALAQGQRLVAVAAGRTAGGARGGPDQLAARTHTGTSVTGGCHTKASKRASRARSGGCTRPMIWWPHACVK